MSEIEEAEKSLRKYVTARRKVAGDAPFRMPGPMRECLRREIDAMADCDPVFEPKSGFGIAALLKFLVPAAAVATVALVSYQSWQFESNTPGVQVATAVSRGADVSDFKSPAPDPVSIKPAAEARKEASVSSASVAAAPRALAAPVADVLQPSVNLLQANKVELSFGTAAGEGETFSIAAQASASDAFVRVPTLAEPGSAGYGTPREATLAPTVPIQHKPAVEETDTLLARAGPDATRFRSSAPGSILSRFALRRSGGTVELIDADGSRYLASTEEKRERSVVSKMKAPSGGVPVEHFSLSGTNQTIGRNVLVTGSIFEAPIPDSGEPGKAATRIHAVIEVDGQKEPITINAEVE